ncbi:MAG: type II toxin-antitoxin system VapC family toxin [Anaerolineae bacterium]
MSDRLLVDTGAIFAFAVRSDAHHDEAVAFTVAAHTDRRSLLLCDVVFAETMTLLKARAGAAVAVRVGAQLRRSTLYQWLALGPEAEARAWALFSRYTDKEWSYTDCSILAVAQLLGLSDVFTYDRHFDQMPGINRLG